MKQIGSPILFNIFGGLGAVAGSAITSAGNSEIADAQNQAAQEAYRQYLKQTDLGKYSALYGAMGKKDARAFLNETLAKPQREQLFGRPATAATFTDQDRARLAEINARLSQPVIHQPGENVPRRAQRVNTTGSLSGQEEAALKVERDALIARSGGDPGLTALLPDDSGDTSGGGGGGYLGEMSALADSFTQRGRGTMAQYGQDTNNLLGMSTGLFEGQKQRIDQDAGRALTGANRMTAGRLAASGLGDNTLVANQQAGNANEIFRSASGQKNVLDDAQKQFMTNLYGGRLAGGTSLSNSLDERELNLRQAPIAAKMQLLTGGTFNPMLGGNTTQYYPGMSPGGVGAATFGNSLSAFGGQMSGQGGNDWRSLFGNSGPRTSGTGGNGADPMGYMRNFQMGGSGGGDAGGMDDYSWIYGM